MSMSAQVSVGGALAAFVAGVLSFFSPCVAPLVPGYIGYLSGSAIAAGETATVERASSRNIRRVCLIFVAGFSCAFVALGLLSATFIISVLISVPINTAQQSWSVLAPPSDWAIVRDRWQVAHLMRSTTAVLAFTILAAATTTRRLFPRRYER